MFDPGALIAVLMGMTGLCVRTQSCSRNSLEILISCSLTGESVTFDSNFVPRVSGELANRNPRMLTGRNACYNHRRVDAYSEGHCAGRLETIL